MWNINRLCSYITSVEISHNMQQNVEDFLMSLRRKAEAERWQQRNESKNTFRTFTSFLSVA